MRKLITRFLLNTFAWCFQRITYWIGRIVFAIRIRSQTIRDGDIRIFRGFMPQHREEFPEQVHLALELLQKADPHREKLVRDYVRAIADSAVLDSRGCYVHDRRLCAVNYDDLRSEVVGGYELDERLQRILTVRLASLMIHEATHGKLLMRGVAYTDTTWEQSERICRKQEVFFLNRVACDWKDLFGQPVDWSQTKSMDPLKDSYLAYRAMSPWDRLRHRLRAAWEAATRIVENEDSDLGISVYDAVQSTETTSKWSEFVRSHEVCRAKSPLTPSNLDTIAYSMLRVGLPVNAVDCYRLTENHGWKMPWFDRFCYAQSLFTARRLEEAIDVP